MSIVKSMGHAMLWSIPTYLAYKLYMKYHSQVSLQDYIYLWTNDAADDFSPITPMGDGMRFGDKIVAKLENIQEKRTCCTLKFYKEDVLMSTVIKSYPISYRDFDNFNIVKGFILQSMERPDNNTRIVTFSINN